MHSHIKQNKRRLSCHHRRHYIQFEAILWIESLGAFRNCYGPNPNLLILQNVWKNIWIVEKLTQSSHQTFIALYFCLQWLSQQHTVFIITLIFALYCVSRSASSYNGSTFNERIRISQLISIIYNYEIGRSSLHWWASPCKCDTAAFIQTNWISND